MALSVCLIAAAVQASAQTQADEYRIKAAFIYHFAQLVEWPAAFWGDANGSLNLCTIGEDPFRGELENSVDGKPVGSHILRVRHAKKALEARGCQIVFIGKSEEKQLPEILMQLAGTPALTVGESDHFAQQGGMIQFLLDDDKIRFDINVNSAQKSGLKISSKLLLLAREVIGNQGGR